MGWLVLANKMKWRDRGRERGKRREREGAMLSCSEPGSAEESSAEHGPTSSFVLNRHYLCKQLQSKNHKEKHALCTLQQAR